MLVCFSNRDGKYRYKDEPVCVYDTDNFICAEVEPKQLSYALRTGGKPVNVTKLSPRGSMIISNPPCLVAENNEIFIHISEQVNKRGLPYRNAVYVVNKDYYSVVPLFMGVSYIIGADGEFHGVGMLTPPEYIKGGIYCREYTIKMGRLIFKDFVPYTDNRFFRYQKNFLSFYKRSLLF